MKKNALLIFCTLFLVGFLNKANAQVQIIETVAGIGTAGYSGDGASGLLAEVNNPYQLAVDKYGNVYFADQGNSRIRKIDTLGIITTVAGTGAAGYSGDNVLATTSKISGSTGVAVDTNGNLYIADVGNNRIRLVTASTGIITTIAGTGTAGFSGDGGSAIVAKISGPRCITLDDTGNIYFSDAGNQRIRKITIATGDINTVAGGGTAGYAGDGTVATLATVKLDNPRGVAVDSSGNIYIADMTNNRIRMVTASTGIISTIAGTGTAGYNFDGVAATTAELDLPAGVSLDGLGDIYIADVSNNRIRMIDPTGTISTVAGDGTGGYAGDGGIPTLAELSGPIAVAFSATGYYISDRGTGAAASQRIRYVRPNNPPTFLDSTTQFISVCENSTATDITANLMITDADLDQTETWSPVTFPINGTLNGSDVEASTGVAVSPIGLNYTPYTGYSGADSFIIQVTDGYATSYDTIYVNVNPLPSAGSITGTSTLCTGDTSTFVDTASLSSGSWISSNTGIASVNSAGLVTGVANGTAIISYAVSNACGFDTANYSVSVNTNFVPGVTISANPGDTSCFGLAVTYIAVPVSGGASPTYQWDVNGTPMATTDTFIYTPNNGDVISCTLTSDAPCVLVNTVSATVTMVVNTGVIPAISISDGVYGDTVCIATNVPYTATTTYGGSSPSFLWNVNGIAYATGNPFIYQPSNGDVITCQLSSSNLCAIPDTATSNSITMLVNTTELPLVTISTTPGDSVCAGTSVTFSASSVYGGTSPTFLWNKDGVNVATGPDFTFTPVAGDSIYCILNSNSSCRSVDSVYSDTVGLTVDSALIPIVTISSISSGSSITIGAIDTLIAIVSNATSPTYQWEVNGIAVPGATLPIFTVGDTVAATASITCVVTSSNPCHNSGTSNTLVIIISDESVKQVSMSSIDIQLVPNPNKGNFYVQGTLPADMNEVTLEVTDIVGRIVYREVVPVQNGMLRSQVALDNQSPNGVYLMHISGSNANEVIRFTLNR